MSPTSSTTTRSQRPMKSSSRSPPATAGPQTCMTLRSMTTPSAERSLHHCSLRSEKTQRAVDKLITLLKKVCCQVSRRLSVMLEQGDLFRMSLDHQFQTSEKIHVATWKMSRYEIQADSDRRNIQKLNGVIQPQRGEICHALAGDEQHRRDHQLIHEQLLEQNRDLREAHEKSLNEMEELKRFQGSTFHTISRRKLIEDRDTILEFTGKIQELRTQWTIPRYQSTSVFPTSSRSWRMLSRPLGMPSHNDRRPSIWDTHGISGNDFANPDASSSAPFPQELNPWISNVSEHTSPHVVSESQTPAQGQRCQSGVSARNASTLMSEDLQRIMGQTNNNCRFQIHILTNSPRQQRSLVGR